MGADASAAAAVAAPASTAPAPNSAGERRLGCLSIKFASPSCVQLKEPLLLLLLSIEVQCVQRAAASPPPLNTLCGLKSSVNFKGLGHSLALQLLEN